MKTKLNKKEKELYEYLNNEYKTDRDKPIAIMIYNTDKELFTTVHGDKVKDKNVLIAGILCKVIGNLLIEAGFDNIEDLGTAYAMLEAYNTPIEKLNDIKDLFK